MRLASLDHRAVVVNGDLAIDVFDASEGKFSAQVQEIYDDWAAFREWADTLGIDAGVPFDESLLQSPAPNPRQLFAIGLNYRDHAVESGHAAPEGIPPVFTKYQSSITGPVSQVRLPQGGHTDWEIELVVVMGEGAVGVSATDAWHYVAGLTVGQDLSERSIQLTGPVPQFSLGKSYPGFTPMGPCLVTPDEFADPDDLHLVCSINGEQVQVGDTSQLIFSIPALIESLSAVVALYPGDVIFTGTPAGVGLGRTPQRWLQPGDVLRSEIEGIGVLVQRFVSAEGAN